VPSADPDTVLDDEPGDRPAAELPGELFYRGTLIRLLHGMGAGVVRSAANGREIPFELQHVVVLGGGSSGGRLELSEGMEVGFDVGWTSRGLRVTKLFPVV